MSRDPPDLQKSFWISHIFKSFGDPESFVVAARSQRSLLLPSTNYIIAECASAFILKID